MGNEVFIKTDVFTTIVNELSASASECLLEHSEIEEPRLVKSSNIMSVLEEDSEQLIDLVERYRVHSSQILPESLDKLRQSLVDVDRAVADALHHAN